MLFKTIYQQPSDLRFIRKITQIRNEVEDPEISEAFPRDEFPESDNKIIYSSGEIPNFDQSELLRDMRRTHINETSIRVNKRILFQNRNLEK